jgi:hypothetical protein
MKKLILLAIVLAGCTDPPNQTLKVNADKQPNPPGMLISKTTFEEHQYLIFKWYQGGGPVHDPKCPKCQGK